VFPILRLLVWGVIAAALATLAFSGANLSTTPDALQPSGAVVEPTVEVETGTITNTVTVPASVAADPPVPVRATLAGTVEKLLAENGQAVAVDTPILQIVHSEPQDPVVTTNPDTGEQTSTERPPKLTRQVVKATVAGTLSLPTLKDQVVAVGDQVAAVAPGTLSVSGTLTAAQQYRLVGAPAEASVQLAGGPAPFTCTGLRIGAAADAGAGGGAAPGADPATSTDTTTGRITCAVPPEVLAFAGLGATIEITNGEAKDAPMVPVTAVQGSAQTGNVWLVPSEGADPVKTAVGLGLTDGEKVQVTSGLTVGQTILQFIPVPGGAGADCSDPATADPALCQGVSVSYRG
jgi:multidrug efflux pump subunit AcrA (membrane-fusion protein)